MTTTPAGSPSWTRTVDVSDYGGDAQKSDYLNIGPVNPRTDVSCAQFLRLVADMASATRAMPLCTIEFTCRDTLTTDPLITSVTGQIWSYSGSGFDGGSPPTGYPTVTRIGDGHVRVTFASSYSDDFGVSGDIAVRAAIPSSASTTYGAAHDVISSTVVDVWLANHTTGAAAVDGSGSVTIW